MQLFDQPLPSAVEAERAVLGSCLIESGAAAIALGELKDEDFSGGARTVFRAIREVVDSGERADVVTVSEKLVQAGMPPDGLQAIRKIVDDTPSSANIEYYCRIVLEHSIRRGVIAKCYEVAQEAYTPTGEISKLLGMESPLAVRAAGDALHSLSDVLHKIIENVEQGRKEEFLPTGLGELDGLMDGGLYLGELTILAGRPSMGKTSLAGFVAQRVAAAGVPSLYVNLEMRERYLAYRWLAAQTAAPLSAIRRGREVEKVIKGSAELAQLPIRLSDAKTAAGIRASIVDAKLVIVDFLNLMTLAGPADMRHDLRIGQTTKALKRAAKELNVHVLLLCQLNRKVEDRRNKRPMMSDLKESGEIEQDADNIMLLYRPGYYDTKVKSSDGFEPAELALAKQKNGPTGRLDSLSVNLSRMEWTTDYFPEVGL